MIWVAAGAVAIVAAIALVAQAGANALFTPPPPPAPVAVETPVVVSPEKLDAVVVSVEGTVERFAGDAQWSPVVAGQHLVADDSLRTSSTGRAELSIGEKSRLTVTEQTELKVRELTRAVHQVQLTRGRLVAAYDDDGERVLRIEDEKGSAVAETRAAKFSILSNGRALAVATETGTVNLNAAGKTVAVAAGQQAFANAGEAPSSATPISAEVLLKIARAQQGGAANVCAVIEGRIDPGSVLAIDGVDVEVSADGRFRAEVARREGQKALTAIVTDPWGRTVSRAIACNPAAKAQRLELKMNWTATDAG